jgi:protein farnesyltransferase subunit beta
VSCLGADHLGAIRMSDAYHSCYVLSGLSSAQHQWGLATSGDGRAPAPAPMPAWTVSPLPAETQIFDPQDQLFPIHPVYAIPQENQQAIRDYFSAKGGF